MGNVKLTTLDELDRWEQHYSQKQKRQSVNLRARIGDQEKVIFCYYDMLQGYLLYYILTDIKIILPRHGLPSNILEINLKEVRQVSIRESFLGLGGGLRLDFNINGVIDSDTLFEGVKDRNFLQSIMGIIQKAKANLGVRLHSSTININASNLSKQSFVAEQLEKLSDLYKSGVLTEDEYKRAKERVLSKD